MIGGFCLTAAANIINQVIEKDLDILMNRTKKRPIPENRVTTSEALYLALILTLAGFLFLISRVNVSSAFLTLLSLILYAFVYTPLKRITPWAVFIGAFPGALPPLIGWVAYTNNINIQAVSIFLLQFMWQFPHFWAIAWVLDDDYKKAGFRLLPSAGGKNIYTVYHIIVYTLFLIPFGLLPTWLGVVGNYAAMVATLCGVLFLLQTFYLLKHFDDKSAKKIMFGSFLYLPVVQITFLLDKL